MILGCLALKDKGHRTIVGERDPHIRSELSRRNSLNWTRSECRYERVTQHSRRSRLERSNEIGSTPAVGVREKGELRYKEYLAVGLNDVLVKTPRLVWEYSQGEDFFNHGADARLVIAFSETYEQHHPVPDLPDYTTFDRHLSLSDPLENHFHIGRVADL